MRDVKCPRCERLLCKVSGASGTVIELKCRGGLCAATVVVDETGRVRVRDDIAIKRAS